ncbi:WG repeat-containing protein [Micromonospora zhanjiangensis]|uniref:WG repeat-containing protein n=1 Tax=Micromonospora zhanjiangensis TaxID=1522057 RepID=A0ABV8KHM4_9ACTN
MVPDSDAAVPVTGPDRATPTDPDPATSPTPSLDQTLPPTPDPEQATHPDQTPEPAPDPDPATSPTSGPDQALAPGPEADPPPPADAEPDAERPRDQEPAADTHSSPATADGLDEVGQADNPAAATPAEVTSVGPAAEPPAPAPTGTPPSDATASEPTPASPDLPGEPTTPTTVADPTPASAESAAEETGYDPWFTPLTKPTPPTGPPADPPTTDPTTANGPATGTGPTAEASPDTVLPAPDGPAAGAATALRAPTVLAPVVRPGAKPDGRPPGPTTPAGPVDQPPTADPEQVLSAYRWRFHHETLRELVEDPEELRTVRDRLTDKLDGSTDNRTRARLLSLRAVVSRILGDLGKAYADGRLALSHAEATGELRRIAIAQARLAHVLQWRGDFAEADRLFEEANSPELPDRLRATMHEHAGRSCYDQGRYIEACNHFERALELRRVEDPDLIARTELALDAVFTKVAENGWGPYPRTRDEVLQTHRPPVPTFSERVQRWGYAEPDGQLAIAPSYAEVQPFREGLAWVRRPEADAWELIDESGDLVIRASAGYLHVGSFSDGLAWVSRAATGGWIAIDRTDRVVIPVGFDDVRPFRRGIAAVRRGRWGAVDRTGQVVVPMRWTGFATALTDGRYVDGFTDEGLAIVDADGRKGVVDRTGRVIVPPTHPGLVIHPVAFLVSSGVGHWGALDRRGEPLIDPVHPSRVGVLDEIDRLLADTKPVL